jgi:hypothetical protein
MMRKIGGAGVTVDSKVGISDGTLVAALGVVEAEQAVLSTASRLRLRKKRRILSKR